MKNHMKRPIAPNRWNVLRKTNKFIARPNPGPHSLELGIPLVVLLRDMTGMADNAREARYIATKYDVLVDGKRRGDVKMMVGLMDTISIPVSKHHYRVIVNNDGKIDAIDISEKEAGLKLCKISGKKMNGKRIQLTTHDGRNLLVDSSEHKIGDTLVIEVPSQKVIEHLKLEPKMLVYLVGGKHAGSLGTVEDVQQNKITYKSGSGEVYETLRKHAFVIGKTKPAITLQVVKHEQG